METETCETLYRFFRTASEYVEGYRSPEPYPTTFTLCATGKDGKNSDVGTDSLLDTGGKSCDAITSGAVDTAGAAGDGCVVSAAGSPEPFRSMQELYDAVTHCTACVLGSTRIKAVPGEGPEELSRLSNSVEVMVIGEGPGADEDRQGRPFVGRAGQLLDKMLEAIQLSRKTNCYITNVVKCRPPQNRDPAPQERNCCAAFLDAQIRFTRPKLILVMGRIAAQHLLQTADGIGKLRGHFFDYQGIPLMPTYHPSALLRDESLKRPAWEDLKRFRSRLQELRIGYPQKTGVSEPGLAKGGLASAVSE